MERLAGPICEPSQRAKPAVLPLSPLVNIDNRIGGPLHLCGNVEIKIVIGSLKQKENRSAWGYESSSKPSVGVSRSDICSDAVGGQKEQALFKESPLLRGLKY